MKPPVTFLCVGLLTAGCLFWLARSAMPTAVEPLAVPLKPDPPPAMDGELREWASVPNAIQLNRAEQVVYGRGKWTSPDDLSATVWLAWRGEYLFVAVDVTDDKFRQTQRGGDLCKGDHVELYLDTTPLSPSPTAREKGAPFGKGQFHFGFSPGNFQSTGDALFDLKPEAVVFTPNGMAAQGVLVAAKRTEKGYGLEAAVPWSLVGVKPAVGVPLSVEIGASDTDSDEPAQESLMTILTATWAHTRDRLAPVVLSPADGKTPVVVNGFDVLQSVEVKAHEKRELTFNAPKPPPGRDAVLTLKARLHFDKPAGYTHAMRLTLNGTSLDVKRLLNKKPQEERVDGNIQSMAAATGDILVVGYSPDFTAPDAHPNYAFRRAKVCDFELVVTDLLKEGANVLVIENLIISRLTNALIVGDARIEFRPSIAAETKRRGPPTGPLPLIVPASQRKVNYTVKQEANHDLLVTLKGETHRVESEFSTPEPKWQKGSNRYFIFQRQIEQREEAVLLRDTFTNLTGENLPVMQRHRVTPNPSRDRQGAFKKVWLAGLSPSSGTGMTSSPENPTTFGATDKVGVGLMPLDDVFQVHVTNFSDGKSIGLADNNFVLKPKATHTAEWAIVLTTKPDYFAFVNAARRLRGVNFTIDGAFAFLRADPRLTGKWTDEQLTNFVRFKSAKFLRSSIDYPRYNGHYPRGTAFQTIDHSYRKEHIARLGMKITRLKSSVTLLTQPWRVALAKRILSQHPLIGNGTPHTRTMASLHFPRFVETGSISNCARAQLFTPIALGDHLTERSELDAYRVMLRALDFGCVYYWYNDMTVIPTHPHLTQFMFPITPMELGEGFIIGLERILTNRSGMFGWNDNSKHEVHVFDDEGREVKNFRAEMVKERDKTFTALRLAEGWSAAMVRKQAAF